MGVVLLLLLLYVGVVCYYYGVGVVLLLLLCVGVVLLLLYCIGVGFSGRAVILITRYKPLHLFTVVRCIDLETLSTDQMEEVQQEMTLSQQLSHKNIACYLSNFVVGIHLWAVQPLMHYGKMIRL